MHYRRKFFFFPSVRTFSHFFCTVLFYGGHYITKQLIHQYGDAPGIKVYADLEGYKLAGGTIPPHLLTTSSRPDLVVSNAEKKELHVYELTCPFDAKENIAAARKRKLKRYQSLPRDVKAFGGMAEGGRWRR